MGCQFLRSDEAVFRVVDFGIGGGGAGRYAAGTDHENSPAAGFGQTGKKIAVNIAVADAGMYDALIMVPDKGFKGFGFDVGITVDDAYFREPVQTVDIEDGTGRMQFVGSLVVVNFAVEYITERAGIGSLEGLHVDRIHFGGGVGSEDTAVHDDEYAFSGRFGSSGGYYGIVEIEGAVGAEGGGRTHGSGKHDRFVAFEYQVEEKCRFFHSVRTVCDDDPVDVVPVEE